MSNAPAEILGDDTAKTRLKQFIERIENLEEEKREVSEQIKSVYTEAKGTGFDPGVLKKVIGIRKKDRDEWIEEEHLSDVYLKALGMLDE